MIAIEVPPLRDRKEDLPGLARHLLDVHATRYARGPLTLDDDALAYLTRYPWPGNVRELANALEHAVVVSRADRIGVEALPDRLQAPPSSAAEASADPGRSLEEVERRHIERVLVDSATLEEAAARLGISSTTLWRKRKRYRID